jgi:hypothetical protein
VNFYLVGNVDIFMRFVFAVLSNIEMDERFHEKDNECDQGNYNKNCFHDYLLYMSKK